LSGELGAIHGQTVGRQPQSLLNQPCIFIARSKPIVIGDKGRDAAGVDLSLHPSEVHQQVEGVIDLAGASQVPNEILEEVPIVRTPRPLARTLAAIRG